MRPPALARIYQNNGEVSRGSCRHHIARVLLMPRRVADDELAFRRGEVAVGHIDGDALLALGLQAVGEQRQIYRRHAALLTGLGDSRELVFEDRLRVVQQAADQRALAVVHRTGGDESQ